MPTDTKLDQLIINYLTEEQYKNLVPNENELYLTPDESAVYQPLEITFAEDSDKNILAILTDVQYEQLLSAINNKEEIIAYGNYNLGGQPIKLPLIQPIKTLDNGAILVYSGVCGYVSYVLGSSTMNWVLMHNLNGDGSHVLGLLNVLDFSKDFGIYINSSITNEMTFADGAGYYDWNQSQGNKIKFDSINGKPILHTSADINSYYAPTTINATDTPKILQCVNSTMSWADVKAYYNHFIKIIGNASEVESGQNIVARLTIQSSNNLVVDTPEKLSTLLGEEFELGCNGLYSNYNITGLKKTVDGTLSIIYNDGGAEKLLSAVGITLTITDTVKTI